MINVWHLILLVSSCAIVVALSTPSFIDDESHVPVEYSLHTLQSNFTLETPLTTKDFRHCVLWNHATSKDNSINSTRNTIGEIISSTDSGRNFRILILVESRQYLLFQNWLQHYQSICSESGFSQLEIVCMDTEVHDMISRQHLHCSAYSFQLPTAFKSVLLRQSFIWVKRMEITIQLIEQGFDLILSDIDAIWRKDPFKHLSHYATTSDIVSSRGKFPAAISSAWGATLCMGFIYFRSNALVLNLLKEVLQDMQNKGNTLWRLLELNRLIEDFTKISESISPRYRSILNVNMSTVNLEQMLDNLSNGMDNHHFDLDVNFEIVVRTTSQEMFHNYLSDKTNKKDNIHADHPHRMTISIDKTIYGDYRNATVNTIKNDLEQLMDREDNKPDDQWSINNVLNRHDIRWEEKMTVEDNVKEHHGIVRIAGKSDGLPVTLLPHKEFLRHCTSMASIQLDRVNVAQKYSLQAILKKEILSSAVVAHCLTRPGPLQKKIKHLQAYGLWSTTADPLVKPIRMIRNDEAHLASNKRINKIRKRTNNKI